MLQCQCYDPLLSAAVENDFKLSLVVSRIGGVPFVGVLAIGALFIAFIGVYTRAADFWKLQFGKII